MSRWWTPALSKLSHTPTRRSVTSLLMHRHKQGTHKYLFCSAFIFPLLGCVISILTLGFSICRTILHTPSILLRTDEIEDSFLDGGTYYISFAALASKESDQIMHLPSLKTATLLLNDGRQGAAGVRLAQLAAEKGIPIVMDCDEPGLEGSSSLLNLSNFIISNRKQMQLIAKEQDVLIGMLSLLSSLPQAKFIVTTLGHEGSLLMERENYQNGESQMDYVFSFEELWNKVSAEEENSKIRIDSPCEVPQVLKYRLGTEKNGERAIVYYCPAYVIPPDKIVDTTGMLCK